MNANSEPNDAPFAAFIGLDWGDTKHALALREAAGQSVERSSISHSAEEVRAWLHELQTRFAGKPVALALETSKGPLIHIFNDFPWLVIYPIHPATSARYRRAFTPSGAAINPRNLISVAPQRFKMSMAATAEPPVASIGSTT